MRTKIYFLTTFLALSALSGTVAFAGIKDGQLAFKSGNWKVFRSIDSMKDTIDCTGIYKDNFGVQLTSDTMFVSIKGGLETVTLRFGDKPARPMRLAEKIEKNIRSIIISGSDFSELMESDRLRIQASTLIRGIANEDFDLSGIQDALESIKTSCPIQATTPPPPKQEELAQQASDKPSPTVCTDVIISRMKAHGIKQKQINAICK